MKDFTRQLIQNTLNAQLATSPPCPLVWDNQKQKADPKQAYALARIEFGKWQPAAIGREFDRMPVKLTIVLYLPEETGTAVATTMADRCDAAFQKKEIVTTTGGSRFTLNGDEGCTGPIPAGRDGGNRMYQLTHNLRADIGRTNFT